MAGQLLLGTLLLLSAAKSVHSAGEYARVVGPRTISNTTYDFIVIGGGIGGLTVADRLTEDPDSGVSRPLNNIVADQTYSDCFGT